MAKNGRELTDVARSLREVLYGDTNSTFGGAARRVAGSQARDPPVRKGSPTWCRAVKPSTLTVLMSAPLARSFFTSSVSPLEQAARKTAPSSKRTRGLPRLVCRPVPCRSADSCSVSEPRQRRSCSARRARADSARFPPRCSSSAMARAPAAAAQTTTTRISGSLVWPPPPPSEGFSREMKAEAPAPPSLLLQRLAPPTRSFSFSTQALLKPPVITGLVVRNLA